MQCSFMYVCTVHTSNDDILEPPRDGAPTLRIKACLVSRAQPGHAVLVRDQRFGRLFWILPVSLCQLVAGHAELAALANGDDVSL